MESTILKLGVAFMILLVTTTSLELNIAHAQLQQAQLPSSSLSKPISVKITSPIRGQQVPVGNNLTVSGVSKYNATSNCQVSVILDGIKPYQKAFPIGSSEADYSNWKYTLNPAYPATIKEGTNKITAKLLCQADPTNLRKFYSINVTGVNSNLENLALGSNNTYAGPSFASLSSNSSLTNPLPDPAAAANVTNSVVPDPSSSSSSSGSSGSSDSSNTNSDEHHHHHSSSTHHSSKHHHDTSNSDNNSVKKHSGSSGSSDSSNTNDIRNPLAQKIINHVKQELNAHGITFP